MVEERTGIECHEREEAGRDEFLFLVFVVASWCNGVSGGGG